jgi:hypothetical protein
VSDCFVSRIERTGPGDLVLFRDAVLTYCAALRKKCSCHVQADGPARELLEWLGVPCEPGPKEGIAFVDPTRASHFPKSVMLAPGRDFPDTPLSEFRDRGYLGVTLFAALVRSSYGPDEPEYYPTQSELGFYFEEDGLLREAVRWDSEYLEECQAFFFEELTPAELLNLSLASLPDDLRTPRERFEAELLGVAFLIGEQGHSLRPLSKFLGQLLRPGTVTEELRAFLSSVSVWDQETVSEAWEALAGPSREALTESLLAPVEEQAEAVLLACGRDLLQWRAEP